VANVRETIPYLLSDFDGTMARTSQIPEGGVGVDGAYHAAIAARLSHDEAIEFDQSGGHKNRTPLEIVSSLRRNLSDDEKRRLARGVAFDKIDILIGQIGSRNSDGSLWPQPTAGFSELWNTVSEVRSKQLRRIGTGVISAGHTEFIIRWLEKFDIERPDVLVTADAIGELAVLLPADEQSKPNPLPLNVARSILFSKYGDNVNPIVYVGDDPVRDGGLAASTGSEFVHVDETNAEEAWRTVGKILVLPGYNEAAA
jgi:hypothetical protein